ncbi:hypothetical protein KDA_59010 [Dictyobacter alpinus]|uniref:Uncharacterized protein n=1 Tax=Dictyobacter alpinus TaxID=2014873 RepID=A0A402BGN5_9CHLR|nr:hypothetical protein [Dictyobacter alpinus]GCE30417.1 hypothetical protein KDA_59010 [Dictyobacter alpinus]
MALFNETLVDEIMAQVRQHYQELAVVLGMQTGLAGGNQDTLGDDLRLLIQVANGECTRSVEMMHQVESALDRVMQTLTGNALQIHVQLPDAFWKTDTGILLSRTRWWISADDLITISTAAALAFGENTQANRMRIVRAMDKGLLEWVPDPSVVNPQQNKRVLRPQVERLRDQRSLPE